MGTLKLNRNSNGTKNSAEVAEAVKRADRRVKAAVKKDFAAEALNLAAQCGYTEEQSGLRTANSVVVAGADKDKKMCKIISARPQFYLGEEGDYKKISNSLTDNGGEIVNGENSYKVAFDKDAHSGKIFDLRKGEKVITLSYGNAAQARAHDCGCGCQLCADVDNKVMATLYDGTQIEYLALNDRIKENIIINSRQEKYEYDFTLQIGDMTVEEGEHSDLLIKDKETGETEFIIPAPYMFDAAGVRSDKVRYEIDVNGGELAIKVIADQSFINAAERAFPVTVDPQIKLTDTKYLSYCTVRSYHDGGENDEFPDELHIEHSVGQNYSYDVEMTVHKREIVAEMAGEINKVELKLDVVSGSYGYMEIRVSKSMDTGRLISYDTSLQNLSTITVDITKEFKETQYNVDIDIYPDTDTTNNIKLTTLADFSSPKLVITYNEEEEPESIREPFVKEIPLVGKATARFDVKRGKAATVVEDCCLSQFPPINVSHIYKQETTPRGCGENWRLNLHRQLKVSEADDKNSTKYTYINEYGEKIALEEKYYYINDYGVKNYVSKQNVTADIEGNLSYAGYKVCKCNSAEGYTLIPEINDFKFAELVETRSQELIQLEDYVAQTQVSMMGCVVAKKSNVNNKREISEFSDEGFKSLYESIDTKTELLMTESEYNEIVILKNAANAVEATEADKQKFMNSITVHERKQKVLIESLRKLVIRQDEIKRVKAQTPVCFIKDESGEISGFNREGNLVFICDEQGNYASITYDGDNRIKEIAGENGVIAKFEYARNLLTSVTDAFGRQIKYGYNLNKLIKATYADGSYHTFAYSNSNGITEVCTNGGLQAKYSVNDFKRVTKITVRAQDTNITDAPLDSTLSYSKMLSELSISYQNEITTFTDKKSIEKYSFNADGTVATEEITDESKRTQGITYTYSTPNTEIKTVKRVVKSNVAETEQETFQYDADGKILSKETGFKNVSSTVKYKTRTTYSYDENGRLIQEIKAITYYENNAQKPSVYSYVKYHYNAQGQLTLTESFVEGEEKTSGINFEEKVYNDDGNVVKYIRWNSLNSSTRFYEECEVDEKGRVTSEKDEAGEVSAEYAYSGGEINSVKLANGSTLAYGRNPFSGAMTGVTQSTEQGEENATEITYNYGLPVKVQSGNTALEYTYDYTRRKSNVSVNGATQVSYAYQDYNFNASQRKCRFSEVTATYADGTKVVESRTGQMNANNVLCLTEEYKVNGVTRLKKTYDEKDRLTSVTDSVSGTRTYTYDNYDNVTSVSGGGLTEAYTYDSYGLLKSKAYSGTSNISYIYTYKDNAAKELESISVLGYDFKPLTDVNGRNTGKEIYSGANKVAGEYITYRKVGDRATNMPATVWYSTGNKINESIKYKYDKCGNISEIRENGHLKTKYTYDSLNRLIREDNKYCGTTFVFSYDQNGNITERCEYPYTLKRGEELEELECTHYTYDYEGDKLVNYNGETFAYNALGNPTIYRGKTANWLYGKLLANYNGVNFAYNGAGQRVSKGNITFTYDSDGKLIKQSNGLEFIYDASGVAGVLYNGGKYIYRKDAQGNVVALLNADGEVAVRYEYDAWGNHVVTDKNGNPVTSGIGVLNPFRYRGYYYDTETELYYLQTRYYDPELGRFISQDSIEYAEPETINGLNLYAYCGNNPVMNIDPTGEFFLTFLLVCLGVGLVAGATIGGVSSAVKGENVWDGIWKGALVGLMIGGSIATIGAGVGFFAAGSIGASIAITAGVGSMFVISMSLAEQLQNGGFGSLNINSVVTSWGIGLVVGALIGGIGYAGKIIGGIIGQKLGLSLAGKTLLGAKISSIISKGFLTIAGEYIGGAIVGGLAGKFINDLATGVGLQDKNIPTWLATLLKFLN